jgi:Pyruvate/2-oxoglutarate dehydrogenase complex, dehydrogenase (E1) component, eukaryotic type, beta subunit
MPVTTYLDAIREAMIEEMRRDPRVFLIGEDVGAYGGAFIAEKAFDYLDAPVKRIAALDVPTPYSPPLEAATLPDKARVLAAARELLRY